MRKYKNVLFDLDGTLLNTIEDVTDSVNQSFLEMGYFPNYKSEDVITFIGNGVRTLFLKAAKPYNFTDCQLDEILEKYARIYKERRLIKTKPFEGVIEVLTFLKSKGYKMGVISNKSHVDVVNCVDYYFPSIFDFVVGRKDGVPEKPNAEVFIDLEQKYKMKRNSTIYIGDMTIDIEFAKNVGMDIVIYSKGYGGIKKNMGQTYTINDYQELRTILED